MCRLLAYMGTEISLYDLILKPQHSLEKQAWEPRELKETKLNADGFGFSWYKEDNQIGLYRQSYPIWNDANLKDISQTLKQKLFFAMVRSATVGLGMGISNTQPFIHQQWMYQHNGYIFDFAKDFRGQSRHLLSEKYENIIQGNTDSEYIFALLMHHLQQSNDPVTALTQTFNDIEQLVKGARCLLNITLTDGDTLYASKHALNGECPSLHYGHSIKEFPVGSQIIASEALNDDPNWQSVDDHSLIIIKPDVDIEILKL